MLRGGICGSATKATPESPKSARRTAFEVASAFGSSPRKSADISGRGRNHGFDHEAGLGHAHRHRARPTGGMAMQTPTPKISGNALFRCLQVHRLESRADW